MKKFYLLLATLFAAGVSMGAPLSPTQALQRSAKATLGQRMAPTAVFRATDLCYTLSSQNNNLLYVFANNENGFAILSADDVAEPILAYNTEGTFDANNIPENMAWWLDEYGKEIENAIANPRINLLAPERPYRDPIAPLVTTRWNQGNPYNLMCPDVEGKLTYSGCVATAMAQVMKHHNWPDTGSGSHSYSWTDRTLQLEFDRINFDWDNMTDIYNASSTEAENKAVAQLMYACGVSVDMNYGLSGSGAYSSNVPGAMTKYFKYGTSTTMINRIYTPLLVWENYIYQSLKDNAPCYYSGQNLTVGHAFVCDGYSADGFFHFNWGWGGLSDGYFRLSALDPRSQGIGGSNNGYNINQSVIVEALPKSDTNKPTFVVSSTVDIVPTYDAAKDTLTITGVFRNSAAANLSALLGIRVTNLSDNTDTIFAAGSPVTIRANRAVGIISVAVPKFPNGTYVLTPVAKDASVADAQWMDMLMVLGEPTISYMKIKNNVATFTAPEADLMNGSDFELLTPFYVNRDFKVKFKISNSLPTEVYRYFLVCLLKNNSIVSQGDPYTVDLMGGQSEEITFIGSVGNVAAGNYDLAIVEPYGSNAYLISDRVPVTVKATPTGSNFSITNLEIENANAVNCSDMKFSFKLKNTTGYFSYPIYAYVFPGVGGYAITNQVYGPVFATDGETLDLNYVFSAPDLSVGSEYIFDLRVNGNPLASTRFKVATNAVETLDADSQWSLTEDADGSILLNAPEALTSVDLFDMAGIRHNVAITADSNSAKITTNELTHGIYILRATTHGVSRTFRIVK